MRGALSHQSEVIRHTFHVWFLLLPVVAQATSAGGTVAPVPPVKPLKPIEVKFHHVSERPAGFNYLALIFEMSNPNVEPVPYSGYLPDAFQPPLKKGQISPLYELQYRRAGKWETSEIGWCGMGLGPVSIEARVRARFDVPVEMGLGWDAVSVGVVWQQNTRKVAERVQTAWSPPVTREHIEKAGQRE